MHRRIAWGSPQNGVRFGLSSSGEAEAGGTVVLDLTCENASEAPITLFGFAADYPRALRISPPKPTRPFMRLSFGDVHVLHPPEAFTSLRPGQSATTRLDVSFAFDRRGAGRWQIAFGYDPVRASAGLRPWAPSDGEATTGIAELVVTYARALREAGIDPDIEAVLDDALLRSDAPIVERLRNLGGGGAAYAARRVARILSPGADSTLGWRALEALALLGEDGLRAALTARDELPHATVALDFAIDWITHGLGQTPAAAHLPFTTMLDRVIAQPDMRGNFIASWTPYESPVHGLMRLEVLGRGECIVTSRAADALAPTTRRRTLSAMQMQTLLESIRYAAVWLLRPMRDTGLPDEPRPALEAQLGLGDPFARRVAMWNGEWRHGPAAPLASLLDRIATDA